MVDSWETNKSALNIVNQRFNKPLLTLEDVKARPQKALSESFPETFGERWQEAKDIYYKAYQEIHLDLLTPHQGAEQVLTLLKEYEIYTAVVSNKLGDNLRKEISHLNWDRYFKAVVGANDTSSNKPEREPVLKALSSFSGQLDRHIWFIGDSPIDMQCALEINATAIYVGLKPTLAEAQHANPSLYPFNNLNEATKTIELLLKSS